MRIPQTPHFKRGEYFRLSIWYQGSIYSIFYINSEAYTSEYPEEKFPRYYMRSDIVDEFKHPR